MADQPSVWSKARVFLAWAVSCVAELGSAPRSAVRNACFARLLTGNPTYFVDFLIGSPIAAHSEAVSSAAHGGVGRSGRSAAESGGVR